MARHTTFRVGGPADVLFMPEGADQLIAALEASRSAGVPAHVIGNGSNLIVRDGGIRGLVIAIGEGMSEIARRGDTLEAQAGAALARVAAFAMERLETSLNPGRRHRADSGHVQHEGRLLRAALPAL